jgi:glycosyltransferase involved in cell wall biosynthesis
MKVSVLLISYNQEQYIKECVESILMQEVAFDLEIVVADDHSTDATLQIITNLLPASNFPYKVLTSDQNLGMRLNYKRGFAACTGEFIAIMEGDDYWCDPRRLEKHIAFLDAHQGCVMSFNRLVILNEEKGTFMPQKWEHTENIEYITTPMLIEQNRIGNLSACVVKKSAFITLVPEIHEIGFADWLLGMAMGELGTLVKFSEPMSVYRVHRKGIWSGKTNEEVLRIKINITLDIYDDYLQFRYHKEFCKLKKGLKAKLRQHTIISWINKYIPTDLMAFGKAITPINLRRWIIDHVK